MKTLIVYASKYGFTADCVQALSARLDGDVAAVDVGKAAMPDLGAFDTVVLGGPVYMGRIPKTLAAVVQTNLAGLKSRGVALFLTCGLPDQYEESLRNAFPAELIAAAVSIQCFGGELRIDRMKGMDRIISGMMSKTDKGKEQGLPAPRPDAIQRMAEEINRIQRREQL
jgi:menaquinone-dependent protoporphyrinogen oxidase